MSIESTSHREPFYTGAFSAGLLDPTAQIPAILSNEASNATLASRYNIYRNNVTVSLVEALAAIYPAVQRATGADFFRAMARSHVRQTPPDSPLLFEYGRAFPAFIAVYVYARPLPWLADVARVERAWLDAYHAADAEPLQPSKLAGFPSDKLADLVMTPHPAMRVVRSSHPAVTLFAVYRSECPENERINSAAAEDALVTRPEFDVVVRHLPPGHACFIEALISGRPLGQASAMAFAACEDFDLAAALAGLLQAGAFHDARIGETSCSL